MRTARTRLAASLLLLAASALPAAGEPAQLSLGDALARGRAGAPESAAAGARQRAAEARARQAAGSRLPQVRLSEQWIRTDSPADVFGLLLNQERFSFPTFVAGDPNAPAPLSTAISRLELELPIWTGGELSARIAQARLAASAAGANAARAGDQAALAAGEAWVRLAEAREALALLEKSRETVAAHAALARDYAAQGMIVRSELLRAEVELAKLDDLLAEARGNARLAEDNLAFRLGETLGTAYSLAPLADPPPLGRDRGAWSAAADRRQDLAGARQLLAAGELEPKALAGGLFPRIGLVARHDLVDDHPFGGHGDSTTVAALATFDLFDGGRRRAALAAARAEAEAARADVARFTEGVKLEAQQAFETAAVALERRRTAAAALAAAAESVRIVEERFRAGVLKTADVLDAATAARDAEMRELVARSEAWLAALKLAVAAGERPETVVASEPSLP